MARRLILLLVLGVVLALFAAPAGTSYSSPSSLNAVASWLAQRQVTVRCLDEVESANDPVILWGAVAYVEGFRDAQGAWHPFDYTVFSYGICEPLEALMAGGAEDYSLDDVAFAVLVLTHESGHLRGHRWSAFEDKTECWAIRHVGYVASRLGVTDPVERRRIVVRAVMLHRMLPAEYQLPGCRLPA